MFEHLLSNIYRWFRDNPYHPWFSDEPSCRCDEVTMVFGNRNKAGFNTRWCRMLACYADDRDAAMIALNGKLSRSGVRIASIEPLPMTNWHFRDRVAVTIQRIQPTL